LAAAKEGQDAGKDASASLIRSKTAIYVMEIAEDSSPLFHAADVD
jgi:hypothetical protein